MLTFLSAPDFAAPTDSDADNEYEVNVTATNSAGIGWTEFYRISVCGVPTISTVQTHFDLGTVSPSSPPPMIGAGFSNIGNADLMACGSIITGPSQASFSFPAGDFCVGTLAPNNSCLTFI